MKPAFAISLLTLAMIAVPAQAQTAYSDEVCMGTALFGSDKATDPDTRKIVGMLEAYYLGKLRAKNAALSLSDAVSTSLDAFGKEANKGGAVQACLGGLQDDIAHLDTLNEKMSARKE